MKTCKQMAVPGSAVGGREMVSLSQEHAEPVGMAGTAARPVVCMASKAQAPAGPASGRGRSLARWAPRPGRWHGAAALPLAAGTGLSWEHDLGAKLPTPPSIHGCVHWLPIPDRPAVPSALGHVRPLQVGRGLPCTRGASSLGCPARGVSSGGLLGERWPQPLQRLRAAQPSQAGALPQGQVLGAWQWGSTVPPRSWQRAEEGGLKQAQIIENDIVADLTPLLLIEMTLRRAALLH